MDMNLLSGMGLHPKLIGPAKLDGFRIQIGARATLIPEHGSVAYGVIAELAEHEATWLYSGSGLIDYRAETVEPALIDSERVQPAFCYNLPEGELGGRVNTEYAEKLSELVQKIGFSPDYAREILEQ